MVLDVFEARRVLESRHSPIQSPQPLVDIGILIPNHPLVRLEQQYIHRVESDYCHIQPDICLCDVRAEIIRSRLMCEMRFNLVQVIEQIGDGVMIRFL